MTEEKEYTVVAKNVMDEEELYHDTGSTVEKLPEEDVEKGDINMIIIVHGREYNEQISAFIHKTYGIAFVDEEELMEHF